LRFLLPSVRDIIFIFLFWSLLAGPLSNRPLADADIGWHIRTGEQILATHSLPRTDPFSSTMQGQPWVAWEWLYDMLLGILHRACGLNGVVWLCALLVAAIFAGLLSMLLRRGTGLLLAVVLMLLAEAASTIHLYARPHIVSWLFSLLWFAVLERWELWENANLPRWIPWFFPVSMLLWVNLHGGWLFGMALLGIYAFAAFVAKVREKDAFAAIRGAHRARAMAWAWAASAAATLVNPYGWRLHAHIYRYLGDRYLMSRIDEFQSPDFHGWAERCFAAILVLALIAIAGSRVSGNRASGNQLKLRLSHLLVVLLAAYAGFYSSRNLPVSSMLLVLVAGPILWENFASLADRPGAWRWGRNGAVRISDFSERMGAQEMQLRGHLWPVVSVAFAFAICLQGGWLGSRQLIHAQFDVRKMPVAAVNFLQKEFVGNQPSTGPVFSTDAWGGYLIYRMYPERKVVIDDRHDLYGSGRIRQYLTLTRAEPGWQGVLEQWQIRTALLPSDSTLANLLRELPQDWRVAYEDKVAVVFERR
jgi:ABC-type multidrug transport system fused ATPase/permease subunit